MGENLEKWPNICYYFTNSTIHLDTCK